MPIRSARSISAESRTALDQVDLHRSTRLHGRDRLLDPFFQHGSIFLGQHGHDRARSSCRAYKSSFSPSIFHSLSGGPCSASRFFDWLQSAQGWPWLRILRCRDQAAMSETSSFRGRWTQPGIIASPLEKVAAAAGDFLAIRRRVVISPLLEGISDSIVPTGRGPRLRRPGTTRRSGRSKDFWPRPTFWARQKKGWHRDFPVALLVVQRASAVPSFARTASQSWSERWPATW